MVYTAKKPKTVFEKYMLKLNNTKINNLDLHDSDRAKRRKVGFDS